MYVSLGFLYPCTTAPRDTRLKDEYTTIKDSNATSYGHTWCVIMTLWSRHYSKVVIRPICPFRTRYIGGERVSEPSQTRCKSNSKAWPGSATIGLSALGFSSFSCVPRFSQTFGHLHVTASLSEEIATNPNSPASCYHTQLQVLTFLLWLLQYPTISTLAIRVQPGPACWLKSRGHIS
jgi:hypothetical protein